MGVTKVRAGPEFTCAVASGQVYCWGERLGVGNVPRPTQIAGLASVVDLAAGNDHVCALLDTGDISCFGVNSNGQLGDVGGNRPTTPSVVTLPGAVKVTAVAAGVHHTCALTVGGTVLCWGENVYGQVGNGTSGQGRVIPPEPVMGLSGVVAIGSGTHASHTCAILTTGTGACWGHAENGQFGSVMANQSTPFDVAGLDASPVPGAIAIGASYFHTCFRDQAGTMSCMGRNAEQQLGRSAASPANLGRVVSIP